MVTYANKFTPEVLLSAPRRSAGRPNCDGTCALYTISTYSFESHSKSSEVRILDLKTTESTLLTSEASASEPNWLDRDTAIYLQGSDKGTTLLLSIDVTKPKQGPETLATFDGSVSNLKIIPLGDGTFAIAVTGQVTPTGALYNSEKVEKPHTSGRVYSKLFVRHWDQYVSENTNTIWYGTLKESEGRLALAEPGLINALSGQKSPRLESPVPTFGGAGDFDIGKAGIIFIAKDPTLDDASYTKTDLYYVALKSFSEPPPAPKVVKTGNLKGYCGSPVFSPDAKSIAFTRMKSDKYESDKQRILLIPNITDLSNVQEFFETKSGQGGWDRRPDSILWSGDGKELYVTAEKEGRNLLWKLPASPRLATSLPEPMTRTGTVIDVKLLKEGDKQLFISSNSLIDSSTYSVLDPSEPSKTRTISSSSKGGKAFGLNEKQCDEIWFDGAESKVHALIMKPSQFDKNKKYPLAYLIHGGPQGAWNDGWSTRWNPAIFAEQGYVVVTPNPTGSTGYGMAFQNGIRNEWGGKPYLDLVAGFQYIEKNMPYVDTSRAVALGASYGGYMCNWIQGHDLGRKFKALVTHDGVFSTLNQYCSDELFFPYHDFGGTLWENRKTYEKWDPAKYVENWKTPHLIIHNELDYRLPISEGLAPFNVLQTLGVPSRFLTFPDENHWVLKPENSLLWHKEVLGWINKYSGIEKEQRKQDEVVLGQ